MADTSQLLVYDGFTNLRSGMNSSVLSSEIAQDQYARGVNITCRNGVIATRPPFIEVIMASAIEGAIANITTGKFQGMSYFQVGQNGYIAFGINGYVYVIDPVDEVIYDMTAIPGAFNHAVDRLHYCQVEEYLVVQDGTNVPLIISEAGGIPASRKADQTPDPGAAEVPTGTVMAYVHGRLFLKTENRSFVAGDINMPAAPGNVLRFTETQYLAGGGGFSLPSDMGDIVSMIAAQSYDESTGEGPMMVMCQRGIASYQVSVPRMQWQDMPIMKIEPGGKGCASEFCTIRMNEDLLFMSWDGIQDFALLNVESSKYHRMTNLDAEVKVFVDQETRALLPYTHAAKHNDRYLYTAIGETVTALKLDGSTEIDDYRFKGLISLDFAPQNGISSMGENMKPAYDGIWTGVHPMGLASGIFAFEERCYVFGKDNDGINHLYELQKEQGYDNGNIDIECRLYTRSMPFIAYDREYPRPVTHYLKKLIDGSLWINKFENEIEFTLSVNPDHGTLFHEISTINVNAPMALTVVPYTTGLAQARAKEPWPAFKTTGCSNTTRAMVLNGFELQFLITWAGKAQISKFMLSADAKREIKRIGCDTPDVVLIGDLPDDFGYDVEA